MKLRKLLALAMAAVLAVSSASVAVADGEPTAPTTREVDSQKALEQALEDSSVDIINITGDFEVSSPVVIEREVIINGKNSEITTSKGYAADPKLGGVFRVVADNVTINGLTIEVTAPGAGDEDKYGIQFWGCDGGELNNVTVTGGRFSAVCVNSADVTINGGSFSSHSDYSDVEISVGSNGSAPSLKVTGKVDADTYFMDSKSSWNLGMKTEEDVKANIGNYVTSEQNISINVEYKETADEDPVKLPIDIEGTEQPEPVVPDDNNSNRSDNDDGGDYFGNETWDEVKREIAEAEEGDTIKVSATGLPYFPSSVARALKGLDITLEIRKNGITYEVNGLEIGDIDKIWYEFDELETELLTADADSEAPAAEDEDKDNPDTGR